MDMRWSWRKAFHGFQKKDLVGEGHEIQDHLMKATLRGCLESGSTLLVREIPNLVHWHEQEWGTWNICVSSTSSARQLGSVSILLIKIKGQHDLIF